jgi:dTDP-4-dehydrorhamnose 3,5-epimerase
VDVTPSQRIPDLLFIQPKVHLDRRGFFLEGWHRERLAALGLPACFVQQNHSHSVKGVLRGLHYQLDNPQGKLVRVVAGEVFDVAVDLRRSSPTFGGWDIATLSSENHCQLWIPPGFAHGFYVMSDTADVLYECTEYYLPDADRALRWNDPGLGIPWPLINGCPPILSSKDAAAPGLDQAPTYP